jgi:hypothetical protein
MEFFDAPRSAPESEPPWIEPEPKPWHGPPTRTLPGRLADTLVLAHTHRVAVVVGDLAAYPTGFTFSVQTIARRFDPREWSRFDALNIGPLPRAATGELPPELLRFGVQFADGGRATSLDAYVGTAADPDEPPQPPLLQPRSGSGGGGQWRHDVWVWPLPPAGPLTFACEWPALDIALSRRDLDAERLQEAAGRSRLLWDDDDPGGVPV